MLANRLNEMLHGLCRAGLLHRTPERSDAQLLEDHIVRRDAAALEAIVRRHGPMVWGVCRRLLASHHDAEDAFQATFLVMVRKAASVRHREQLANWLHGVARQTALKARATAGRKAARERQVSEMPEHAAHPETSNELRPMLDHELSLLPESYRAVLVLCDLEGQTRKAAASILGLPAGTVASRLARARALLAKRLARHGPAFSGGALAALLAQEAAAVPSAVLAGTIGAVHALAAGQAVAAGAISARAIALTEGVVRGMLFKKLKAMTMVLLVLSVMVVGGAMLGSRTTAGDPVATGRTRTQPPPTRQTDTPKAAPQVPVVDLKVISHKLFREPGYGGQRHWYCLLVFGPRAETKVWLVHDPGNDWFDAKDDMLYVDRNGNGDLTEPGEAIAPTLRTVERLLFMGGMPPSYTVTLPTFRTAAVGGKGRYTDLAIVSHGFYGDRPSYTISVKINGKHAQTTTGGTLQFGTSPEEAPVVHFDGPLTLHLHRGTGLTILPGDEKDLTAGKKETLIAMLGSKGLGTGTFAAFDADFPPVDVNPAAEVVFSSNDPREPPFTAKCDLSQRCCGMQFRGQLRVPFTAAGTARVKLSLSNWSAHRVTPAEFAVPVVQPPKKTSRLGPIPEAGIVPTDIAHGMTKKQVLDYVKADWRGAHSVPDAAMQAKDIWDITEPWPIARGTHFIRVQFQGGLVEDACET
jgi:RNA polymerase sigma factor (sigma-70 family)